MQDILYYSRLMHYELASIFLDAWFRYYVLFLYR